MNLIFLGPPGVGKGTQARLIEQRMGIPQIATGDILRTAIAGKTPLGEAAGRYMSRGDLVPDAVMIEAVAERLQRPDTAAGFILDGFPRTIPQAEALDAVLVGMGRRLDWVIAFEAVEDTIVRRMSGRRICRASGHIYHLDSNPPVVPGVCDVDASPLHQRDDDQPETIRRRMQVYREQSEPLVAFYQARGVFAAISAEGEIEEIYQALLAAATPRVRG
jgi:adenylate kinase